MPTPQELYQRYLTLEEAGRKPEAKEAVREFIAAFPSWEAKQAWVQRLLAGRHPAEIRGNRIRHEIYESLVFPVLLEGYRQQDARSLYCLATTAQNLYRAPALHALVDYKTEWQLLREAFEIDPSEEIRHRLLRVILEFFTYAQHEWPAGILYGMNGACFSDCQQIHEDIAFARSLDTGSAHESFLREFERKVTVYQQRLVNAAASE